MKHPKTGLIALLVSLAPVIVGCQEPLQPTGPTVTRITVDPAERYAVLWETVGDVLRKHFFQLDRRDRQAGIITTFPETTAGGFEFWRPQPTDPYYWWEASLHTIQRRVTVKLAAAETNAYDVDVQVDRMRYRLEERQITNAGAALRLYGGEAPTYGGQSDRPSETARWIALGRDESMEQKLLATILNRFGVTGQDTTPPESEETTEASPPTEGTDAPEPGNRNTNGFTVPNPN